MKTLLRPAVLLLNRLSYPRKLALIGLVFLLPLVFSGFLLLSGINANIAFAGRELAGLESIQPLKKLLRAAQEHRGVAQLALSGDPDAPQRLDELEMLVDEEIRALDGFDAKFGKTLNSSEEWKQVKANWDNLRAKAIITGAEDSFRLHTAFVECVQDFLLHLSDASGLSLDPALNTHYLIAVVTVRLTHLTESLGQTRALSANASRGQMLSMGDRYRLTRFAGDSQRIKAKLLANLETAFALTPGLRERMGGPLKDALLATDDFLSSAEELLLQTDSIKPGGQDIFRQGTRAIDAVYHLCEVTLPMLEQAIKARAGDLMLKKRVLLALGATALLLAAYLFFGFTSALIQQMSALRQGAKAVAEGNLNAHVVQDSQDEMARIAYFFNSVVDSLRYQMARVVEGEERLRLAATVFEGAAEGIMITDAAGTIMSVNRAFSELTGYAPQEAAGKTPALLKSGRHPAGFYQGMWQEVLATGSWQGEVWDRRKDGALFPAWLTISVVRGENGAPQYFVGMFSDISQMKESQQRIEYLANFDALTALPNRNLFHDRLKHAVARAARQGGGFALMFIDLDNFKTVNDTLGHEAGDMLLQEAARRLEKCIRDGDTAARIGGDEFTVLLETGDKIAVTGSALRIVDALAAAFTLHGSEVYVTCSIGISLHPDDGADDQTLMKNADIAMYRAKVQGKNSFRFFGE